MNQYYPLLRRHFWVFAAIIFCILLAFAHGLSARATAGNDGTRIVTIYDGGLEKTFATNAKTVGEALSRGGVKLAEFDAVEPSAKSELIAHNYHINVHRARPVAVIDGDKHSTIISPYKSARKIVENAQIQLHAEDIAELERPGDLDSHGAVAQLVNIDRATPVSLILFGKKADIRTQGETVEEFLEEKNIVLQPQDEVSEPLDKAVVAGMTIEIYRDGIQTFSEEQDMPFTIRRIEDKDRDTGFREIREAGVVGKRTVTYEVNMQDRKEVSRKELQSVVTVQPKEQIEVVGVKGTFSGSFADALAQLRACEAGGRYDRNSGNGYYGAYQFSASSWRSWAPPEYKDVMAYQAPPAAQDQAVWSYYQKSGWNPWPGCKAKLGLQDIYR
jgi:resuscitation-promoting factor RpfB